MKYLLFACIVSLMLAGGTGHSAYLDDTWYAELTNVRTFGGNYSMDPYAGYSRDSPHIAVTASPGTARFDVVQSGDAPGGEEALWYGDILLDPMNTWGNISFDYETYWTLPGFSTNRSLELVLTAEYIYQPSQVVWSSSALGLRSGHVEMNAWPQCYSFSLVVLPEPGGFLCLSSLLLTGSCLFARRRRNHQ